MEMVIEQLEAELRVKAAPDWNPADLAPDESIFHIIDTHHQYSREELPRLPTMAVRVAQVHGGHTPSLIEVLEVFYDNGGWLPRFGTPTRWDR